MTKRLISILLAASALLVMSGSASAFTGSPGWQVTTVPVPTSLAPGGEGFMRVDVFNIGSAPSTAGATLTDTLPAGITSEGREVLGNKVWACSGTSPETCSITVPSVPAAQAAGGSDTEGIKLAVHVEADANNGEQNSVTVAGGGAPGPVSASAPVTISNSPAGFGISGWKGWLSNADGTLDTQAGSHPYEGTFVLAPNVVTQEKVHAEPAGGELRNVGAQLPAGLVGNPNATPECTREQFEINNSAVSGCPTASQVGVIQVEIGGEFTTPYQIFNMVPPPGIAAQFGFTLEGIPTFIDASVNSGGNYAITARFNDIVQRKITHVSATFWGDPADPSHNLQRGLCIKGTGTPGEGSAAEKEEAYIAEHHEYGTVCASSAAPQPFLTLPTACEGPLKTSISAVSWADFSAPPQEAEFETAPLTGCEGLDFGPSLSAASDTSFADTPAGLTVDVKTPQPGLTALEGLSTASIKATTVELPQGLSINPGQAAGLAACQTPESAIGTDNAPSCPNNSKVGEVHIKTPLLESSAEKELVGDVYVLQSNPPELKLLAAASADGVNVKLVLNTSLCESAGELLDGRTCKAAGQVFTTVGTGIPAYPNIPEFPITDFKLSFSGGAQAALTTPTECGGYATNADFTSWASPYLPEYPESSTFDISAGTGGAACAAPLPFTPSLVAGPTTDQAGGFTNFSLQLTRPDDQQRVSTLQFKTPKGLLGMIARVPLCPEAQANAGTCPAASQIGHTVVEAGPGPYPLVVPQPGQPPAPIYLTQGYKGAPYGLSIVVPLVVGPFTLQTQIVRAKIEVDPHTAQLTVTTDPIPPIVDGIPTDLRTIVAEVNRPEFMFNPTNCNPQSFSGIATSTEGTQAGLSSHFQVGSCQSLKFAPNFKVSTSGKTSRQGGASLTAKIVYPTGALGANQASSQSNIASVKVDLPKQLPSRLTTLQKACLAKVFESNPAACPKESKVGYAKAITPVLPVPVEGPAYFVSYGNEKFPALILELKGYGVTVDLVGTTFISHTGITSSTFKTVPDVPITSFELTLPQGKFSALAANLPPKAHGSFCGQTLAMPTAFTGQNGAVIKQSTPITVSGCGKSKKAKAKKRSKKKKNPKVNASQTTVRRTVTVDGRGEGRDS